MEPQASTIPSVLRPLSMGELLDRALSLYRNHFVLFFGIALIPFLIGFVGALQHDFAPFLRGSFSSGSTLRVVLKILLVVAVWLLYSLAFVMSQAATMFAVTSAYLQRPIPVRDAYARAWPYLWPLFWLIVQTSIRIGLGFALLVIPGIVLTLNYSVSVPAAIFENLRGSEALQRSTYLTEGFRKRIFLLYFLFWFWNYIVDLTVEYLGKILPARGWGPIFPRFMELLSDTVISPILLISLALIYYDLRVRKEAFDIEYMMASMEKAEAAKA